MRFSMWPSNQASWAEVLHLTTLAESAGWDGVWFSDHLMPFLGDVQDPILECWSTVAALAAAVPRIRIGTLVSGNTYRHPAVVAKMAATIDQISGGRFTLGLGAGWQENEHEAYGFELGPPAQRLARLAESCEIIVSLLNQPLTDFDGRHHRLRGAPLSPKPVQDRLPLLVGGGGERVTLRIAARFADQWNDWGTPETLAHKNAILDRHCAEIGRDPMEIRRSAQVLFYLGDDPDELARRQAAGPPLPAVAGDAATLRAAVADYAAAGVTELVVPDFHLASLAEKENLLTTFLPLVTAGLAGEHRSAQGRS
ncbi:TIGR03560 family F420-dependent LLM class oxidoreductase [Micromonospora sp. NPDC048170]|uniref:TIGR03560 family F420-dependent LLM class oxidoreductase n=1 Tax=Micromonospora sp. NPDC048170 TaxID=3154819 RepID=UPI0033D0AD14